MNWQRVLLVGLGSIGRRHLAVVRKVLPDTQIGALRSAPDRPSVDGVDHEFSMLSEALVFRPDIVIVASPASEHIVTAIAFAEAGAQLLIEKPLSDGLDGVDDLIATVDAKGITAQTGYCLRYHPTYIELKRAIDIGQFGNILSLRLEVGSYLPDWRQDEDYRASVSAQRSLGGGAILELSHELDLARWLGGDVSAVCAMVDNASDLELDVEDTAEIVVRHQSGLISSIHLDMFAKPPRRRVVLVGDKAWAELDALKGQVAVHAVDGKSWQLNPSAAADDESDMYECQFRQFLDCIASGRPPCVDLHDARETLRLALAIRESARCGATVRL
jgi:predicted dehydrogenase